MNPTSKISVADKEDVETADNLESNKNADDSDDSLDEHDDNPKNKASSDDDDDDDDDNQVIDQEDSGEEERLENLVFGSKKTMFKTIDKNKLKPNSRKRKNEQIADRFEKRKAAWEDEDDNQL
jgi:hypothetical protein